MLYGGQTPPPADRYPDLGVLRVGSVPQAYFELAAAGRRRASSTVIGITGTSGKTTTKDYLANILECRYRVHATEETNNLITDCAELLMGLDGRADEAAVVEMGFGWVGDIDRIATVAKPNAGVILKVTPAHLDGAGNSWEVVAREKGRLGFHLPPDGFLAIHAEDPGCGLLPRSRYRTRVVTFGEGTGADLRYGQVEAGEAGTALVLRFFGRTLPVRLRAYGGVQAPNAAASLVAHLLGIPAAEIAAGLARTPQVPHRFEIHRYQPGLTVIDDTFNATPDAMMQGLAHAARLAGHRRRVAFLGGIAKLGERAWEYNHAAGVHAVLCGFTTVVPRMPEFLAALREAGFVPVDPEGVSGP